MVSKSIAKYIRISPTKVRPVMQLVKGDNANIALSKLGLINKKGAGLLIKILKSAVANAKVKGYEESTLFISKIIANPGPVLKRFRSASFGRASMIRKRTSHILIELDTSLKLIEGVKVR